MTLFRLERGDHQLRRATLDLEAQEGLHQRGGLSVTEPVRLARASGLDVELLQDLDGDREVSLVQQRARDLRLGPLCRGRA